MSSYPEGPGPGPTSVRPMDFVADKIIGIILIVLNCLISCVGFGMIGFGPAVTQAIKQEAENQTAKGQMTTEQAQAVTSFLGMGLATFGAILLALAVLGIIDGFGIFKSSKWGFIMGIVIGCIYVLVSVTPFKPLILVLGAASIIYCAMRLTGNLGPRPMA